MGMITVTAQKGCILILTLQRVINPIDSTSGIDGPTVVPGGTPTLAPLYDLGPAARLDGVKISGGGYNIRYNDQVWVHDPSTDSLDATVTWTGLPSGIYEVAIISNGQITTYQTFQVESPELAQMRTTVKQLIALRDRIQGSTQASDPYNVFLIGLIQAEITRLQTEIVREEGT
jgi:hypothetical protein